MTDIETTTCADQLIYTWATSCLDGARGFGVTGISEGLADRVPTIKAQVKDLGRFDPRVSESPDELRGYRQLERRTIGDDAYLISKTCQGKTADGRPGNYCAQLITAPKSELTASLCAALSDADFWIRPYHSADITAARLPTVDLGRDETTGIGRGAMTLPLLREAAGNAWTLSTSDAPLEAVRHLLGVLTPSADVETAFVFETNAGSTSLSLTIDFGDGESPGSPRARITDGDPAWDKLRTRLHQLPSRERAHTMLALYYPSGPLPHHAAGAHRDGRAAEDLPDVQAYLRGDATALAATLDPQAAGTSELCVGVMQHLSKSNARLNCSTATATQLSAQLLATSEPQLDADELDRVLPRDADSLYRLATELLSPAILRGLARRSTVTPARSALAPRFVAMPEQLWPTLRSLWGSAAARAPLTQVLRAGAGSSGSLLQTLMAAEPVDAQLLFEDLFPALWSNAEEAAQILYSLCWTQYVAWSATPAYYADVLSQRRRTRWLPTLLRRGH